MIDFVGKKKLYFTISSVLILVTLLVSVIFGVKMDIQFSGGTMITYSYDKSIDLKALETEAETQSKQTVSVTEKTDISSGKKIVQISLSSNKGLTPEQYETLNNAILTKFKDSGLTNEGINNVEASMGREFFLKCLMAVAVASILMIVYIAFRFKKISGWSAGVMAVIALLHDVLMVFATFVIFRIPLDSNFMAVVLTILGYSVNDTIVIYDRLRENRKLYPKMDVAELVNLSTNQCMGRTINTSVSTLLSMVVVSIVALIFNVSSILTFSFPMIIGMISGVYSTLCIATPLWVVWQKGKNKKKKA